VRGASTITQQLIKNLYLNREKSVSRKLKEFVFSLVIENHVDKNKILETYLNIIEYGKNLYGIKSASIYYFKKNPSQLSSRESAFIAMLLPSPIKYSRSFLNKRLSPFALRIINSVLLKMNQLGAIGPEELQMQTTSRFFWELAPTDLPDNPSELSEEDVSVEDSDNE
jgi:monofunctional biosynthetic peptidoglycan transglycosylase